MAAISDTTTIAADNTSDATFRAWTQFADSGITQAGGWVNTADTGQVNLATVLHPTGTNQSMGGKIYRMNDALQSTKPIFMKLEFGSGSGNLNQPSIWLTIGTGSNGAGTLTGILFGRTQWNLINNNGGISKNYCSVGPARLTLALFTVVNALPLVLSIERTVDPSGADTGEGFIVALLKFQNTGITPAQAYFVPFTGSIPPAELGLHVVLTTQAPSQLDLKIGTSLAIPQAGIAKQPGLNLLAVRSGDFTDGGQFVESVYGSNRTYQHLGATPTAFRAGPLAGTVPVDTGIRLAIRYE